MEGLVEAIMEGLAEDLGEVADLPPAVGLELWATAAWATLPVITLLFCETSRDTQYASGCGCK